MRACMMAAAARLRYLCACVHGRRRLHARARRYRAGSGAAIFAAPAMLPALLLAAGSIPTLDPLFSPRSPADQPYLRDDI